MAKEHRNRRVRGKAIAAFSFALILMLFSARDSVASTAAAATTTPQSQIDANQQQIADLNAQIAEYQAELTKVGADKSTLQSAINSLDIQRSKIETEIAVTQKQIDTSGLQIQQLSSQISDTQQSIAESKQEIGQYLRNLDESGDQSLIEEILSSKTISQVWDDVEADWEIQAAIQEKIAALKAQGDELAATQSSAQEKQNALASQKKSLSSQQATLAATKNSKTVLLQETDSEESKYEALLAQAKAELSSFSAFAQNAGGSGLLTDQTSCDAWGCYYNQRDSAWGNDSLDGTTYRLASDGCLITSMAMVMTHYGYSAVTPETINDDPSNFAPYYPAYLLYTIHVDGATATRVKTTINATLATGNPVIVGLHAYGGTHFVVLISGTDGNYLMRDPYISNGKDIPFSAHYSLKDIYEINKVEISG